MPTYLRPLANLSYWRWGFEAIIITIYGQNRCSNAADALSGQPLTPQQSNSTRMIDECTIMKKLVRILGEADLDMDSMVGWLDMYFVNKPKVLEELKLLQSDLEQLGAMAKNSTQLTEHEEIFYQNSLVLKQFDLVDDQLVHNICYLITFVALCRLGAYMALRWKASNKRS